MEVHNPQALKSINGRTSFEEIQTQNMDINFKEMEAHAQGKDQANEELQGQIYKWKKE